MRDESLTQIDEMEDLYGAVEVLADDRPDYESVHVRITNEGETVTAVLSPKYARFLSRAIRTADKYARGET